MLRSHVICAVFRRNVQSYFSGILGYLFIVVFVVVGAFAAFSPQFFANNLANLDQLSRWFPMLLLFIVPAITMSVWADEKKLGTDELLFTLPASDLEILLGKYLSVLAVYTIALLFSVTHVFVLTWIGDPDPGVMLSTYLGYWLSGAALLACGMFASVLTNSTTVAFVLGAVFASIPIFLDQLAPWSDVARQLNLSAQLRDFSSGVIPLGGILYFVTVAVFALYLNLVLIRRRHWSAASQGNMHLQYTIRALSLVAVLISCNVIAAQRTARIDLTSEKTYSLSPTTYKLIRSIKPDKPITIDAYISPDVPREYVPVRKKLLGLLREYDQIGGNRVSVRFVDVEPFSEEAEEAELYGITSRDVQSERGGRTYLETIFLGAVVRSPFDEVIIPFFDLATPIEYELTRSIHTTSKEERLTVGILDTQVQVTGGFDMQTFRSTPEWRIVNELKKQYQIETVSPKTPIDPEKYDVLLAVMPSSLTQPEMTHFVDYVKQGHPVLIFDDPLPVSTPRGPQDAPRSPKPRQGGGMMGGGPPPEQKADNGQATTLLNVLDIAWNNGQVVWDISGERIHPEFGDVLRPELLFVSPKSGTLSAFSQTSPITSDLQEVVAFFGGAIRPRSGSGLQFEPLLRSAVESGLLEWGEITAPGIFGGLSIQDNPPRVLDNEAHVLAAHIQATADSKGEPGATAGIDVVFVADVDIISDQMFVLRERGFRRTENSSELNFDNVTFVLNAVDVLAGDLSYLDLRKRRGRHRTLLAVEQRTATFLKQRNEEQERADEQAEDELDAARERFREEQERIEQDSTLDARTKEIMLRMAQENEQRRLDVAEANIERAKEREVQQIKNRTERQIRQTEQNIRAWAVALPPLPAILLGLFVLGTRLTNERREIAPQRRIEK